MFTALLAPGVLLPSIALCFFGSLPPADTDAFAGLSRAASAGASAAGHGVAISPVATKSFSFFAEQASPESTGASGYLQLAQVSAVFGDFYLEGPVQCMQVVGDRAYLGMTIAAGRGTAAGHEGEAFYVTIEDKSSARPDAADRLDNSGYTGSSVVSCGYLYQNPKERVILGDIAITQP